MRLGFPLFCLLIGLLGVPFEVRAAEPAPKKVYILPIRDDIMPAMTYLVRRGVKEAMEAKADVLVLDMKTNGGRVDVTEEIIEILNRFNGETVTFVNDKAFSAGAFISLATKKIYMAPQSVIGAAAPVIMSPGGGGVESMPDTYEAKITSALSAMVRANAEKNGHNVEVADAMVKKTKELVIDGKVLNEKGQILTLTNKEAEQEYGKPPKPLLSSGTVSSVNELLEEIGYKDAKIVEIKQTGAERLGTWINAISPILLIIGIIGIYIEIKTPGFGLPGIVGIIAFVLYFLGGYIAGLSGMEWIVVFVIGLALVILELFVYPGTMFIGFAGIALMLVSMIMAMVDVYPRVPGVPGLPLFTIENFRRPLEILLTAFIGSAILAVILARYLPKTSIYHTLVSESASGVGSVVALEEKRAVQLGQVGVAVSGLRPGGKAQFGDDILDVMSQGDMIAKGEKVKIIGFSGTEAIVESVG